MQSITKICQMYLTRNLDVESQKSNELVLPNVCDGVKGAGFPRISFALLQNSRRKGLGTWETSSKV